MGLKIKVAYNTGVQIIGKLFSSVVTFLITALIARNFGVVGYGDFTKITTFVPLFFIISDFGFNAIFLREQHEEKDDFANLLTLRFFWSIILAFICIAVLVFLPANEAAHQGFTNLVKLGIIFYSLSIILKSVFTSANAIFQKKLKYDYSILAASIGSLFGLLLIFVFSQNPQLIQSFGNYGALLLIFAYLIGDLITLYLSIILVKKLISSFSFQFNFPYWKKLFMTTLPLAITLIFNLIYFRVDTFILTIYRSTIEVGYYGLAYRFFEAILVIPTFFMNSLYPIMIEQKENKERFIKLIKQSSIFLILSSVLVTVVIFGLSDWLINLVAGESFLESVLVLKILSFSYPLFFLSSLFMWILITLKKQRQLAIYYGLSMVLNIILNIFLIPRYGMLAAAVTTGVTELFVLILTGITSINLLKKNYE